MLPYLHASDESETAGQRDGGSVRTVGREQRARLLLRKLEALQPFAADPRTRWLTVPAALVVYVPTFMAIYHSAGSVAFGSSFLVALSVAAVAGIGPGILAAACLQISNFGLVHLVGMAPTHAVLSAVVAFTASVVLVVVTGSARLLLRRMSAINRELDEQIRARQIIESNLAESLTLHRNLLATLGEGVGHFDGADRFLFANAAAEKLFGCEPGQLVGRALTEFLTPESIETLVNRDKTRSSRTVYDLRLSGDEPRVVLVTETRMTQEKLGEPTTLRVLRDVTARAKLEQERRELEVYLQRTEALQSLAVLAGGVAHDFNNLLSGVIGSAELGLIRLRKSPETARQCLEDARRYAVEASELSRKMLAYAGKRNVALEAVNLANEVVESLSLVSSTIANKAVIRNQISGELPRIFADRTGLHQVITNLVLNAVEAMDGKSRGHITLTARQVCVPEGGVTRLDATAPAPGSYVVFCVADTGNGIAEDTRSRLFEPFFSTKFQGRGMGLAATLGIVRAHKGGILVESKPGVGTTFSVYWPIAKDEPIAVTSTTGAEVRRARNATVLLVDDEAVVRETTSLLLAELGCQVYTVAGGREAVQLFSDKYRQIDLVILDLTMPEQSGFEVLDLLRVIDPDVRVILTSGYSSNDTVEPLQQAGVVGFLPKPHHLATLEPILQRGLGEERTTRNAPRVGHAEPTSNRIRVAQPIQ